MNVGLKPGLALHVKELEEDKDGDGMGVFESGKMNQPVCGFSGLEKPFGGRSWILPPVTKTAVVDDNLSFLTGHVEERVGSRDLAM